MANFLFTANGVTWLDFFESENTRLLEVLSASTYMGRNLKLSREIFGFLIHFRYLLVPTGTCAVSDPTFLVLGAEQSSWYLGLSGDIQLFIPPLAPPKSETEGGDK